MQTHFYLLWLFVSLLMGAYTDNIKCHAVCVCCYVCDRFSYLNSQELLHLFVGFIYETKSKFHSLPSFFFFYSLKKYINQNGILLKNLLPYIIKVS
jgi:hypothetical protein